MMSANCSIRANLHSAGQQIRNNTAKQALFMNCEVNHYEYPDFRQDWMFREIGPVKSGLLSIRRTNLRPTYDHFSPFSKESSRKNRIRYENLCRLSKTNRKGGISIGATECDSSESIRDLDKPRVMDSSHI